MIHKKGVLRQKFSVTINVEELTDYILNKVIEAINSEPDFRNVEADGCDLEEDELQIYGSYSTDYEYWHCNATRESPAEDDLERASLDDGEWLIAGIAPEIKNLIKVTNVEEPDDEEPDWD